jgi:hypothetical protein
LVRIEREAFWGSGLNAIVIPSSVEVIESYCFQDCNSLHSITFELMSRLRQIDRDAFTGASVSPVLPFGL